MYVYVIVCVLGTAAWIVVTPFGYSDTPPYQKHNTRTKSRLSSHNRNNIEDMLTHTHTAKTGCPYWNLVKSISIGHVNNSEAHYP